MRHILSEYSRDPLIWLSVMNLNLQWYLFMVKNASDQIFIECDVIFFFDESVVPVNGKTIWVVTKCIDHSDCFDSRNDGMWLKISCFNMKLSSISWFGFRGRHMWHAVILSNKLYLTDFIRIFFLLVLGSIDKKMRK